MNEKIKNINFYNLSSDEREKLMDMLSGKGGSDKGTSWMYEEPKANREDYLLGKKIGSADDLRQLRKSDKRQDETPEARFARLDMQMKFREDPVTLMRQNELAIQQQCLQNTVKMKKLQALLELQAAKKKHKKHKKHKKEKKKEKSKKEHKRHKRASSPSSSDSSSDELLEQFISIIKSGEAAQSSVSDSTSNRSSNQPKVSTHRRRDRSPSRQKRNRSRSPRQEKPRLTAQEREERRAQMMRDADDRQAERSHRTEKHRERTQREYAEHEQSQHKHGATFVKKMTLGHVSSTSIEESIGRRAAHHQRGSDGCGFLTR